MREFVKLNISGEKNKKERKMVLSTISKTSEKEFCLKND
jgi:hypothetical protein